MNYTENYLLKLPGGSDDADVSAINYNTEQIDELIKGNSDDIDALQESLAADEETISSLSDKSQDHDEAIESIGHTVDGLDEQINNASVGLDKKVTDLLTWQSSAIDDINGLEQNVGQLGRDLGSLETTVGGISDDVDALEDTVAGHTSDIATLADQVDDIGGDITAIDGRFDTDEGRISDLENADVAIDARLDALEDLWRHTIVLHGTLAAYVTEAMVEIESDSNTELTLEQVLSKLSDWTMCHGLYMGNRFDAIKVTSNQNVQIAILDHGYQTGYVAVSITASGSDKVFDVATTLSIKSI